MRLHLPSIAAFAADMAHAARFFFRAGPCCDVVADTLARRNQTAEWFARRAIEEDLMAVAEAAGVAVDYDELAARRDATYADQLAAEFSREIDARLEDVVAGWSA